MSRKKSSTTKDVKTRQPQSRQPQSPQPQSPQRVARRLTLGKRVCFSLVTCALFFAGLELALIAGGIRPVIHSSDPYVGFSSYVPLFVPGEGAEGETELVTAKNKRPWFNEQRFAAKKPAGSYRIFCLGGSTTYGRPYDDATSFCGWLREFLPEAEAEAETGSPRWEVINAGGISYASYRVARLMEELVRYEPDLFIIYSGHNEFLEARTYGRIRALPAPLRSIGALLSRTRTHAAVQWLLRRDGDNAVESGRTLLPTEVKTLLDSAVGPAAYHRDDKLREQVLRHYQLNLERMIDLARSVGAEVILVTPASNLRDCSPFKSEHRQDLPPQQLAKWNVLYRQAQEALAAERFEDVLAAIEPAMAIDDRYADAHFLRGRALLALGREDEARREFLRAREEDVCPLRAPAAINRIVSQTARKLDVPLVDFAASLEQTSGGLPGAGQFLDHVHPTIEVHRQLALLLIDRLVAMKVVDPAPDWGPSAVSGVVQRVEGSIDKGEHAAALRNLSKVLSWAGKHDEADRLALEALEMTPEDVETQHQAGNALVRRGELDKALACFQRALQLNPRYTASYYGLGLVYLQLGNAEQAVESFERAVRLSPEFVDAHFNLGILYEQLGDPASAERHYRAVMQHQPHDPSAYNNLGILLARQGQDQAARQLFERAISIDPQLPDSYVNLGLLYEQQGDLQRAIRYYQEALRYDPDHATANGNLRNAVRQIGGNAATSGLGGVP